MTYSVIELLRSLRSESAVYYLPNPGNGGDALISVGFFDLAKSIGLTYRIAGPSASLSTSDVLIIGGGGGLVPEHDFTSSMVAKFSKVVGSLIVLPQTARDNDTLFQSLGDNVTIFLRERTSYDYCRSACRDAHVFLDHDMAFSAQISNLLDRSGAAGLQLNVKNCVRLALLGSVTVRSHLMNTLFAFRTDKEARDGSRGSLSTDVSKLCSFGTKTEAQCYYSASRFVRSINLFSEVHTDRLHVSIASAMLGKRTILYDNSYYKCRAVHEMSLKKLGVTMGEA